MATAGLAERIDFAANEEGGRWSVYAIWDQGIVHELWCRDELPDDRWLPIAETLDLEPDPELTSSTFDPVTARPDAGVAMAFPEAWQVRGSSTNQGLLYATSETAVCALSDYSEVAAADAWASVDDMHDEYVEYFRRQPRQPHARRERRPGTARGSHWLRRHHLR